MPAEASAAVLAIAALALLAAGCSPGDSPASREPGQGQASAAASEPLKPTELPLPAADGSGQAHLATGPDGEVVLSWLEPEGAGAVLKLVTFVGGAWSEPRIVTRGEDLLVSWADFPAVVPITSDVWAAHWLRIAPESVASYDIVFALSTDGGASFGEGALLNIDGTLTEHGFVSWFPWNGAVGVVWLDGRRIAEQFESGDFDPDGPPVGTSLRFARIASDGSIEARGEIDELVCDCCRTGAAVASSGPVVVYRDRSADEIRDIAVRRHVGGDWSGAVAVGSDGWRIEGCPVNGPAIDAAGDIVVAAWFTAAAPQPRVRFARSADGGASFGEPLDVDAGAAFGQVDVALLRDGDAVVSWWRKAPEGGIELAVRRVSRAGRLGEIVRAAHDPVAQPLDVPQLAVAGDRLVLAWTDSEAGRVRTVEAPLP